MKQLAHTHAHTHTHVQIANLSVRAAAKVVAKLERHVQRDYGACRRSH